MEEINYLSILIIYLIQKEQKQQKLPDDLIKLIMNINTKEIQEEKEYINWLYHKKRLEYPMKELNDWIIAFEECYEHEVREGGTPDYNFSEYTLEGIMDGGGWAGFHFGYRLPKK